jgi:signal transduction histidine kinase
MTQARVIQAEKLRALSDMAGGVAHDFNNLLTAILARAQFVLSKLPSLTEADIRRCLGVIERAALDGAETVRRLQEFSREAPTSNTVPPLAINAVIESAGRVAAERAAQTATASIDLDLELGPVPPVAVHAADLQEVLGNLLTNAIEGMPEGGRLTLRSRVEDGKVAIEVVDTGLGIGHDVQGRMFEPFFTTKGPDRSGLGLSVAFGIVSRYRGEIAVDTDLGCGTTVRVLLPTSPLCTPGGPPAGAPGESDAAADRRASAVGVR